VRRKLDPGSVRPETTARRVSWEVLFLLFDRESGLVRRHGSGLVGFAVVTGAALLVEQVLVGWVLPRLVLMLRP
jgi:hypothetical protein